MISQGHGFITEVIWNGDHLARYAADIDALFAIIDAPVTSRWAAIDIWLRYQRDAEPLAVLIWSDNGLVVAAAVLAVWRHRKHYRITKIGEPSDPVWLAACDQTGAEAIAAGLIDALASLQKPWVWHLTNLRTDDPVVLALRVKLAVCEIADWEASPQLRFAKGADLKNYLSYNTRSAVAKAINRVARDGLQLEIHWLVELIEVERCLPEILKVLRHRLYQRWGYATQENPAADEFLTNMVFAQARDGRLRLLTVRLDGALAAFAICFLDRGMLWVYANLVSPDWLRYSAGTIANAEIVRSAYADTSINGVNWGPGIQRYKMSGDVTLIHSVQMLAWSSRLIRFLQPIAGMVRSLSGLNLSGLVQNKVTVSHERPGRQG